MLSGQIIATNRRLGIPPNGGDRICPEYGNFGGIFRFIFSNSASNLSLIITKIFSTFDITPKILGLHVIVTVDG